MTNILEKYITDFLKLIDQAYKEGYLYAIIAVIVMIFFVVLFFAADAKWT